MRRPRVLASLPLVALALPGCGDDSSKTGRGDSVPPLHFTDVTAKSGISMVTTSGVTPSTQILEVKGGGLALIDLEQDGDLDLFVPNGATLDAPYEGAGGRTFENQGGLRFTDVTGTKGPDFDRWGFGTAIGDVDGDGIGDIYICCYGDNALYRATGGGRFEERAAAAGVTGGGDRWSTAATFADLDLDGDLDLYVVNNLEFDTDTLPPRTNFMGQDVLAGPNGLRPQADVLFENQGDGTFVDITEASGCAAVKPSYGLGVVALDFDGDGPPEIFVGNDSGVNFLFRRTEAGLYEDLGAVSGIGNNEDGLQQATMGIAVGDVDGDQLPDVFTTNFMNDTNTLHVNAGDLFFDDRTRVYGLGVVSRRYLGWASMFFDFDHDGDEDLVAFNGHVYPEVTTAPVGWMHDQVPQLFVRDGDRFSLSGPEAGAWLTAAHCDRSAVFGDLDLDGDVDMVVYELNGPLRVLENDGATGPWLIVSLRDERESTQNHRGIGARVTATTNGVRRTRWIHTGGGYQSSNPPVAHLGLPGATTVDVEVRWPDGVVEQHEGLTPNAYVELRRKAP